MGSWARDDVERAKPEGGVCSSLRPDVQDLGSTAGRAALVEYKECENTEYQ